MLSSEYSSELKKLERDLENALQPVQPRTEFVGHLRQRLVYPSPEVKDIIRPQRTFWLISGGLIGVGLTILILGLLGVFHRREPKTDGC